MKKIRLVLIGLLSQVSLVGSSAASTQAVVIREVVEGHGYGVRMVSGKVTLDFEGFSPEILLTIFKKSHDTFSSAAVDFKDQHNHKAAFNAFEDAIKFDLNREDSGARAQVAEYLIYGISDFLNPSEVTRNKAAEYLIDAAQIELTKPDEPDHAGRMIRGFSEESYQFLARDKDRAKSFSLLKVVLEGVSPDPA